VGPLAARYGFGGGINHPRAPYPKLLCRVFNATAEELGLVPPSPSSTASITTLNRRLREQASTTPLQRLRRARVRHAQYLLESTTYPVDRIAAQVGFGSPTAFRERFKRVVGTSPHAYRIAFRGQNS
jgi:methylphosphotriester-DNA--protein-cysteine methyltransferase